MNEFWAWMLLIPLVVTVTAFLIAGVIHLAVAADRFDNQTAPVEGTEGGTT